MAKLATATVGPVLQSLTIRTAKEYFAAPPATGTGAARDGSAAACAAAPQQAWLAAGEAGSLQVSTRIWMRRSTRSGASGAPTAATAVSV